MILADTSIWIDHLRAGDDQLSMLLADEVILMHPFVIGELALGYIPQRAKTLSRLEILPQAIAARDDAVLMLIDKQNIVGTGIGYIDVHLLASVLVTGNCRLWTRDKRLAKVAEAMRIAHLPH